MQELVLVDISAHVDDCNIIDNELTFTGESTTRNLLSQQQQQQHVKEMTNGYSHETLLDGNGHIFVCGGNECGQLGLGDNLDRNEFIKVNGINDVKMVGCGGYFTIIVKEDNEIFVTGQNENFQLGNGECEDLNYFRKINFNKKIKKIKCGFNFTIILCEENEEFYGCGDNSKGQLGFAKGSDIKIFTKLNLFIKNIKDFNCGATCAAFLTNSGDIYFSGLLSTNVGFSKLNVTFPCNQIACSYDKLYFSNESGELYSLSDYRDCTEIFKGSGVKKDFKIFSYFGEFLYLLTSDTNELYFFKSLSVAKIEIPNRFNYFEIYLSGHNGFEKFTILYSLFENDETKERKEMKNLKNQLVFGHNSIQSTFVDIKINL